MENGRMETMMRSIREGDMLQLSLGNENEASWRAKASQVNAREGFRKYSVTINAPLGILAVINNGEKYKL